MQTKRRSLSIALVLVILSLGVSLFTRIGSGKKPAAASSNQDYYLVRIDLQSDQELELLTSLNINIFTHVYDSKTGDYLLAQVNDSQSERLVDELVRVTYLDVITNPLNYFLLFPLKDNASDVLPKSLPILMDDGQRILVYADYQQVKQLSGALFKIQALRIHPINWPVEPISPAIESISIPDPQIVNILSQVNEDAIYDLIGDLTGEWSVNVNGNPYTIETRYSPAEIPIKKATRFVHDHLEDLGLFTYFQYYNLPESGERRNVIAELTGITEPERIFYLTAHMDSWSYDSNPFTHAPGADDNASGSTGVIIAADIMSKYAFGCTLRFALFTGEEQGYYGSIDHVSKIFSAGDDIEGVINLDMIGYNGDTNPVFEIHTRPENANDLALASLYEDVIDTYEIDLVTEIIQDGLSFSDHLSFWNYNYPAILSMEDYSSDFTPDYHKISDKLTTLDITYTTSQIKAAMATLAHLGCLLELDLEYNYIPFVSNSDQPLTNP